MILSWHEEAGEEYAAAAVYYERLVEGLGERIIEQMEATLARLMVAPTGPRYFENDCRKLRVNRFPYAVIYRMNGAELQILAVAHAKRRPGYWRERLDG